MRGLAGRSAHQYAIVRRRAKACTAGLLIGLLALPGCSDTETPPGGAAGNAATTESALSSAASDTSAPLISKPPDWYISTTDRFRRVRVVPGRASLSPGGTKLLAMETLPPPVTPGDTPLDAPAVAPNFSCRVMDVDTGVTDLSVETALLRSLEAAPADAPVEVRTTDAGWLFFRVGTGEWKRYFPTTQRAKPAFDGFSLRLLSRNLKFAVGIMADAPGQPMLLDLTNVFTGGVIRIEPLAEASSSAAPLGDLQSVAIRVGDTGVVERPDHSLRLRDNTVLAPLPGGQPWDGSRLRCTAVDGALRLSSLAELPDESDLPENSRSWWIFRNRLMAFDGVTLWAVDRAFPQGFRTLPLLLAEPTGGPAAREIWSIAVESEDAIVLLEINSAGKVQSAVYRWAVLR